MPRKATVKCLVYLVRLESEGHELRPSIGGVHYRILYFFHGSEAVVVSHGLIKERSVPVVEIERAIRRMKRFQTNPQNHTFIPAKGE